MGWVNTGLVTPGLTVEYHGDLYSAGYPDCTLKKSVGGAGVFTPVSGALSTGAISSLFVFADKIYAAYVGGVFFNTLKLFEWDGVSAWAEKGSVASAGVGWYGMTLAARGGVLYIVGYTSLYAWDGVSALTLAYNYNGTGQLNDLFLASDGSLYLTDRNGDGEIWPGRLLRYNGAGSTVAPSLSEISETPIATEIVELAGEIYGVMTDLALTDLSLRKWNGVDAWEDVVNVTPPSFSTSIAAAVVFNDRIYAFAASNYNTGAGSWDGLYSWGAGETVWTIEPSAESTAFQVYNLFIFAGFIHTSDAGFLRRFEFTGPAAPGFFPMGGL